MKRKLFLSVSVLMLLCSCNAGKDVFVFSYFGDQSFGLKLAVSHDGYHFSEICKADSTPFMAPAIGNDRLLRDPSVIKGPDGMFHMVWTTGWCDRIIGHASSPDLVHWGEQQVIPVMVHDTMVDNCWAPELFYDGPSGLYYIFWASSIPGRHRPTEGETMNHRIYAVTTRDFKEFSGAFMFFDPEPLVIDAAVVRSPVDSSLLMAVHACPTHNVKGICISRRLNDDGSAAKSLAEGSWGPLSGQISGEIWSEGPTPFFICDTLMVYYDQFANGTYGLSRSTDNGTTWEIVPRGMYSFPEGEIRHGTVFRISQDDYARLMANL